MDRKVDRYATMGMLVSLAVCQRPLAQYAGETSAVEAELVHMYSYRELKCHLIWCLHRWHFLRPLVGHIFMAKITEGR